MIDKTPKFRVENIGNCYSLKRFSKKLPALIPIEPKIGPKVCKIVNRWYQIIFTVLSLIFANTSKYFKLT